MKNVSIVVAAFVTGFVVVLASGSSARAQDAFGSESINGHDGGHIALANGHDGGHRALASGHDAGH